MRRFSFALATVALIAATTTASALEPDDIKQLINDRIAAHGGSAYEARILQCVIAKESRYSPSARGKLGERGVTQWLPGRGNAWDETTAYRVSGIDIIREYEAGNPDAVWYDIDGASDLFTRGRAVRRWHWASTIGGCE